MEAMLVIRRDENQFRLACLQHSQAQISNCVTQDFDTIEAKSLKQWLAKLPPPLSKPQQVRCYFTPSICKHLIIDKPKMPQEEITPALPWLVKDLLPDVSSMALDYFPIAPLGQEKILVVSVANASVLEVYRLFKKKLSLNLDLISIVDIAYANLLQSYTASSPKRWHGLIYPAEASIYFLLVDAHNIITVRRLSGHSNDKTKAPVLAPALQHALLGLQVDLAKVAIYLSADLSFQGEIAAAISDALNVSADPFVSQSDSTEALFLGAVQQRVRES